MAKLRMPPNCIDATEQYRGTVITLVGAEVFRKQITERRAAIHEAAHAVCGRILGFACGGAAISNDGTGSATVAPVFSLHWDYHARGDIMSSVLDKITVCWAGPVAEDIMMQRHKVPMHDATAQMADAFTDDRGDLAQIKQLQAKYYVEDRDIEAARARARELLTEPKTWAAVERVAAALLEKRTLTGSEIDALVHDNVTTRRGGSQPL